MRRALLLGLVACGRLGYDPIDGATGDAAVIDGAIGEAGPIDAPPLPATLACSLHTIVVPAVADNTDLAVTHTGTGFTAVWAGPAGAVQTIAIDNGFHGDVTMLLPGPVDGIGGLVTTTVATLLVTSTGANQTIWKMPDARSATQLATEAFGLAREPFAADASAGMPRAWLRGEHAGLVMSYVADDGTLLTTMHTPTVGPVTALSAADNFGHGHLTWSEDRGGGSSVCTQADIRFENPMVPVLGGSAQISADCHGPRITSGPLGSDSIFTAWTGSTGEIGIRYLGAGPDLSRTLSLIGRAPKVAFDGTQFWVAWIERAASGEVLRLALVQTDGSSRAVDLPGWSWRGDEAFELVRRGGIVFLVILGPDTLSFIETCG